MKNVLILSVVVLSFVFQTYSAKAQTVYEGVLEVGITSTSGVRLSGPVDLMNVATYVYGIDNEVEGDTSSMEMNVWVRGKIIGINEDTLEPIYTWITNSGVNVHHEWEGPIVPVAYTHLFLFGNAPPGSNGTQGIDISGGVPNVIPNGDGEGNTLVEYHIKVTASQSNIYQDQYGTPVHEIRTGSTPGFVTIVVPPGSGNPPPGTTGN